MRARAAFVFLQITLLRNQTENVGRVSAEIIGINSKRSKVSDQF